MSRSKIKVYVSGRFTRRCDCGLVNPFNFSPTMLCSEHQKRCAKCGVNKYDHELEGSHPFFDNNLRMLEWLNKEKEVANNAR